MVSAAVYLRTGVWFRLGELMARFVIGSWCTADVSARGGDWSRNDAGSFDTGADGRRSGVCSSSDESGVRRPYNRAIPRATTEITVPRIRLWR